MTTHQLANQLLEKPEMPVAVMSVFMEDQANEPALSEVEMVNKDGVPEKVVLISAALTLRDAS